MPISKDAIEKFLQRPLADLPKFKGMAKADLELAIYNSTGAKYSPSKTQPRPHQLEGISFALYQRRALLFYWMRLGKSLMALEWAAHLRKANFAKKKGLIIAHAPVGADVWENQVKEHSELTAIIVRSGADAIDELIAALESDCQLIIMSRSTIQAYMTISKLSKKGEPKLYPDMKRLEIVASYFDHSIIDETHFYGNPYGLPFTLAQAITADCKYRLGLTGTPVGRDPFQVWSQARLIDAGKMFGYHFRFFQEAFGKWQRSWFAPGHKELTFDKTKMKVFQYKLDRMALSYGKGEVKSAEVFAGKVRLQMAPDQKQAYNEAVEKLVALRTGQEVEIDAVFTRLRQIASGYLPFHDGSGARHTVHFENVKLAWLAEFAAAAPAGSQCLIFHEYVHTGELICRMLAKAKIAHGWIHGNDKDRAGTLAAFQSGKLPFLVANAAAGSTAIDLPQADYLCFFESPCSPITRSQAEARPMSRALDRPLVLDDLVCAPVEEKILSFIAEGQSLLAGLMRGGKALAKDLFA